MLPQQLPCCQLLRSLAAAVARQAPSSCSSAGLQQISSRLPALLPPARFSTATQQAWQQLSQCRAAAGWHPQQLQQQLLIQQPIRSSFQLQQLGQLWQHSQPGWGLLQSRSMATRVEQQAAANPGLKFWRPTSPGTRGRVTIKRTGIWKGRPMRCLSRGVPRIGGRNCYGRITVRHRGGGSKRRLRAVDFVRQRDGVEGVVERLEYDPNRTGYIALVKYPPVKGQHQPEFSYILAPQGLSPGDPVLSGTQASIRPGNTLPLKDIPVGMPVHNVELVPGKGGQICRSAGCMATIVNKQTEHAIVRLPSGEQRLISLRCRATIGAVSNPQNKNRVLGKAGANRWRGRRPKVRGVAMNSVDHPMGGGTAGGRPSCSPWGLNAKGKKTRNKHKASNKWILQRRTKRG